MTGGAVTQIADLLGIATPGLAGLLSHNALNLV